jgi:hypothetical protein
LVSAIVREWGIGEWRLGNGDGEIGIRDGKLGRIKQVEVFGFVFKFFFA